MATGKQGAKRRHRDNGYRKEVVHAPAVRVCRQGGCPWPLGLDAGANSEHVSVPATLAESGLRSRLDLARLACMGHSFGALTSICTSTADKRFKACVAHDVWLFPAGKDMVESHPRVPTLFLNASTFDMLWPGWGRKVLARWIVRARRSGACCTRC